MARRKTTKELEIDARVSREIIERGRLCIARLTQTLSELITTYEMNGLEPVIIEYAKVRCLRYGNCYFAKWYVEFDNAAKFEMLNSTFGAEFRKFIAEAFQEPFCYKSMSSAINDSLLYLSRKAQDAELAAEEGETK